MISTRQSTDEQSLVDLLSEREAEFGSSETHRLAHRKWKAVAFPESAVNWAALAQGAPEKALTLLARATYISPEDFRFHLNLSNAQIRHHKLECAATSLRRAVLLSPDFARGYANLAAIYSRAVDRRRLHAFAWCCGGSPETGVRVAERLIELCRYETARDILSRLLAAAPLDSAAWRQRAILNHRESIFSTARRDYCRALVTNPTLCDNYLAAMIHFCDCRHFAAAGQLLDLAECLIPSSQAVQVNRATLLERLDRPADALELSKRVLLSRPDSAELNFNVGTAYGAMGQVRESLQFHERASLVAPNDLRLQNNLAIMRLKAGQYRRGLEAYEHRWHASTLEVSSVRSLVPQPSFDLPLWKPGGDRAKRILLWGEQGIGDEIWGLGYLSNLVGRVEQFTVEIDPRLVSLAQAAFPEMRFLARKIEDDFNCSIYDAQLPLLSLPHRLGLADSPAPCGWARPDDDKIAALRRRLRGPDRRPVIGLGWRSVKPYNHLSFDMSVGAFAELAELPEVRIMPLQYGMTGKDWEAVERLFGSERVLRPDFDVWNDIDALVETASVLDAIASPATMLVPVAVAAGTPAAVLLRTVQRDWRYAVGQHESPMLPGVLHLWPDMVRRGGGIAKTVRAILERAKSSPGDPSVAYRTRSQD